MSIRYLCRPWCGILIHFDQWGVELGKQIAKTTLSAIQNRQAGTSSPEDTKFDASTEGLLNHVFRHHT
ncbi:MAG: hypothetical protein ACJ04N_03395 [Oceanospirillaceae bacterium]